MEQDEKAQDTHVSSHEVQVNEDVRLDTRIWATFSSLAVLSFTISLEAAVLVPVLPVWFSSSVFFLDIAAKTRRL